MIGVRIKDYLSKAHVAQTLLCEKLGRSPAVVSAMLDGRRTIKAEEYFAVCDALGVPLDFFRESA
ncbi:hypothetical protein FACS1894217_11860 [Clostridia bacterium]|nr:hypothetical protein FACS1894217_11860 [Clostridia bacterium]